jgi:S-adenosylmethionine-dependent methyltransferase
VKTAASSENRFEYDAGRYAEYLDTPEGRLRADLTFANVREFLPASPGNDSVRVLDVGCGTGTAAVHFAHLGCDVSLLDSSAAMLELAKQSIASLGITDKIAIKLGDVSRLTELFETKSFDLILCHNVLEYVDDPGGVLRSVATLMRDSSAIVSVLVRNQAGEVLKLAIQTGDLVAAHETLDSEWGKESLYGGKVRLFTPPILEAMFQRASLRIIARRGVRVLSDYLPSKISQSAEYDRIFGLEYKLSQRPEFFGVARYLHVVAQREIPQTGPNE